MSKKTTGDLKLDKPELSDTVGDTIPAIADNADAIDTAFTSHKAGKVTQKEVHGLRIESGTCELTIFGTTNSGSHSYSTNRAIYKKIDDLVYINFRITINGATDLTGDVRIGGLPFVSSSDYNWGGFSIAIVNSISYSGILLAQMISNSDVIRLSQYSSGSVTADNITETDLGDEAGIAITGIYKSE